MEDKIYKVMEVLALRFPELSRNDLRDIAEKIVNELK